MIRRVPNIFMTCMLLILYLPAMSQGLPVAMTMDEAITTARSQSVAALEAKSAFVSSYWAYRSYKASLLPAIYAYGELGSFNRSIARLQNYSTGEYVFTKTYNMTNSAGLAVSQNIALTGGTLRLYSDLSRTDQFGDLKRTTFYSQPLTLYYNQPLLAYNKFKWQKQISPREYEKAKRVYLESMENLTSLAVEYYFDLMGAQLNYEMAVSNYENTRQMHEIAGKRLPLGSVTRDEYLQLELRMLRDSLAINENGIKVREAGMMLNSLLGLDEKTEILPVSSSDLPDIMMDYDLVLRKAMENSSFNVDNEIKILTARSDVAQAKANRGASVALSATFGLSQSAEKFRSVYRSPADQEVVGLTFSVPIFDWGLGKGRVKEAEAKEAVVKAQVEQAENDYKRSLFTAVGQFNSQRRQCLVSERASRIAKERYSLTMDKFRNGSATVTDLNTAQSENDEAAAQYITDLGNYWKYYYTLRKLTLHDFISGSDLDVDYDEMVQ